MSEGGGGWRIVESLYIVCPGLFALWRLLVLTWIGSLDKEERWREREFVIIVHLRSRVPVYSH